MTAVAEPEHKAPRPQDDLFRHVNGHWLATAEIPADRSADGAFYQLRDGAEADSRAIIEDAAAGAADAEPGSTVQLIGDLYRSFMNVETVERLGLAPIAERLAAVDGVDSPVDLLRTLGRLERTGIGGVFGSYVDTDPGDPDRYTVNLTQGGLGLPDESYYSDATHADTLVAYSGHLPGFLDLAGVPDAAAHGAAILELETELAAGHWDRVASRDSSKTYNPMDRAALDALMPAELWDAWLDGLGAAPSVLDQVVVRQPDFFRTLAGLLTTGRLPAWRSWLISRIIRSLAPYGPAELVEKNFDFYGRTLSGTPELRERWKRGVAFVESAANEAVGRLYVERHFPPESKLRMDALVNNLLAAYRTEIRTLPWMSEDTRARALDKLDSFTPKIGYPARWRDYSALTVTADDLIGNAARAAAFELDRELAKLGGPVDRDEWFMSPQTVNAYYNPGMNEIVFPAAILQPPFFDPTADDAVNYGAIGAVIGHEIGHGFDDQGSKYDGRGALHDWWTPQDRAAFEALTGRLIEQYSRLEPQNTPGHHVNGALTIGENIGDVGGLGIAYQAWRIALGGAEPPVIDGLTGAQRFFLSWATVWRLKMREAEQIRMLAIDPHSPAEFRCNQVVRNLDGFHDAFAVQPTDALWLDPADRVRIW
ncbi:M13 family metallopeptidase [Nakamurella sp.]|uniref:M13 family metallopeptidase n=1 Tax=Nakamurella sp. TaxID=1869182 RepID=UPI003784C9C1